MRIRSVSAAQTWGLRRRLLRPDEPPEAVRYPGDTDARSFHVGAFTSSGAHVGIASILPEAPPGSAEPGAWRLRGMATEPAVRGLGYGQAMLRACLAHAARMGGTRVWCNARTPARGFYEREGFTAHGPEFELPPIGPHFFMDRPVRASDLSWGPTSGTA